MSKIYQKMYLTNKSRSKGVLDGFIHNVILRSFYSESQPLSRHRAGFTLIELLVVVLIIGILAAVAVPQYQKAVRRARAAEAAVWVKRIVDAEQEYYLANGRYTGNIEALNLDYQHKWPGAKGQTYPNGSVTNVSYNTLYLWDYEGYIFRVLVAEAITKYGGDFGGYGAQLHARDASQNYPLVCAEYACYGVPAGSFCKDIMGAEGEPVVNGDYCFRLYKRP